MAPRFLTGEVIRKGDVVRLADWDGTVEEVITKGSENRAEYIEEGIMLVGSAFGRLLARFDDEDLVFLRRSDHETAV